MTHALFTKHENTLDKALTAIETRGYLSRFAEIPGPKVYGETDNSDGEAVFNAQPNQTLQLDQPTTGKTVSAEESPFGFALGIRCPYADVDALIPFSRALYSGQTCTAPQNIDVPRDMHRRQGKALHVIERFR